MSGSSVWYHEARATVRARIIPAKHVLMELKCDISLKGSYDSGQLLSSSTTANEGETEQNLLSSSDQAHCSPLHS